jgi:hypothetical protein
VSARGGGLGEKKGPASGCERERGTGGCTTQRERPVGEREGRREGEGLVGARAWERERNQRAKEEWTGGHARGG